MFLTFSGIVLLNYVKTNPLQPVHITCVVQDATQVPTATQISFSYAIGERHYGLSPVYVKQQGMFLTAIFTTPMLPMNIEFTCAYTYTYRFSSYVPLAKTTPEYYSKLSFFSIINKEIYKNNVHIPIFIWKIQRQTIWENIRLKLYTKCRTFSQRVIIKCAQNLQLIESAYLYLAIGANSITQIEFRGSRVSRFVGEMDLWMIGWGSQRYLEAPQECVTHQNDRKECTLDYLDGLGHFFFRVGATGKKIEGVLTTPPARTRVKTK